MLESYHDAYDIPRKSSNQSQLHDKFRWRTNEILCGWWVFCPDFFPFNLHKFAYLRAKWTQKSRMQANMQFAHKNQLQFWHSHANCIVVNESWMKSHVFAHIQIAHKMQRTCTGNRRETCILHFCKHTSRTREMVGEHANCSFMRTREEVQTTANCSFFIFKFSRSFNQRR